MGHLLCMSIGTLKAEHGSIKNDVSAKPPHITTISHSSLVSRILSPPRNRSELKDFVLEKVV
jgi:hypothetical protein